MIFSPFEWMMAGRYLRARRQEGFISVISWFSLLGIGLGVATLIVVMAVMNGFRVELLDRVMGLNGHINIYAAEGGPLVQYDALIEKVRAVPGVASAAPLIDGQTLVTQNGVASGAMLRGVDADLFKQRTIIQSHIVGGSLDAFSGDTIVIGARMATRLGLHAGDTLTLIAPSMKTTVFGSAPRLRAYPIAAIFDVGMYEYDNNFIFMPLAAAQLFLNRGQGISTIEVFLKHPHQIDTMTRDVRAAIQGMDARAYDWRQTNGSFFTALQVERNVMFLILTMIILVAAFNIISGLIMLVKDKGRDIAILRTMGASPGMIMRVFFLAGASIGVAGTFFGLGLGLLFSLNIEHIRQALQKLTGTNLFNAEIYFLSHLPAVVDPAEVVQVILMALLLSFLATLYPSWRAARLDPIEALRYE